MSDPSNHPAHLDPSELGTKEYWDNYYQNDLNQADGEKDDNDDDDDDDPVDPGDLESWFDDVDAPAKVIGYLTSDEFPYSPNNPDNNVSDPPKVLDLGTGNGSMLFMLRMEGDYSGPMVGVDYSERSVDLARKLWRQYSSVRGSSSSSSVVDDDTSMRFEKVDLIRDDPRMEPWWPSDGFDLVLDKGTFDAISLSSETVQDGNGQMRRICEVYPRKVAGMVAPGGYLLITSCNWTEDEVMKWFLGGEDVDGLLEFFGKIEYPVYEFGGQKGSGVASICFRRISRTT